MKCLNCFNECRDGLFFCNICGSPLLSEEVAKEVKAASSVKTADTFAVNDTGAFGQSAPSGSTFKSDEKNGAAFDFENKPKTETKSEPVVQKNDFDITDIKMPVIPKPERQTANEKTSENGPHTKRAAAEQTFAYPPLKHEKSEAQERLDKMLVSDDKKAEVLTGGQFVAMELLLYIPVINIILLLIWCFNKKGNPNRRNYAIAKIICVPLIMLAIFIVLIAMYATGMFDSIIASLENYLV